MTDVVTEYVIEGNRKHNAEIIVYKYLLIYFTIKIMFCTKCKKKVTTQVEKDIKNLDPILNINEIDSVVLKKINLFFKDQEQTEDVRQVVFSLAKKLIEPNLTFSKDASEKKKTSSMEDVKPVFFQVQKNEMIVREGEKIGYL